MIDLFSITTKKEKLHPKYETIKNHLFLTGEYDILKDWIDGFEDRDNKIVYEFQTTFHSSFWEFYLFAVFKEAGFEIDFTKNRPDFIINNIVSPFVKTKSKFLFIPTTMLPQVTLV